MTYNFRKNKRVVRDVYDGKIITDEEAVSLRNIHLVVHKEGFSKNPSLEGGADGEE